MDNGLKSQSAMLRESSHEIANSVHTMLDLSFNGILDKLDQALTQLDYLSRALADSQARRAELEAELNSLKLSFKKDPEDGFPVP